METVLVDKALAALPEDLCSISSTHEAAQSCLELILRRPDAQLPQQARTWDTDVPAGKTFIHTK